MGCGLDYRWYVQCYAERLRDLAAQGSGHVQVAAILHQLRPAEHSNTKILMLLPFASTTVF